MVKIIKILNHNSIIVYLDKEDLSLLVMHKGIGFAQKVNAYISLPDQARLFKIESLSAQDKTDQMLNRLNPISIEIASDILTHAEKTIPDIADYKILPLADHIAFAIQRIQNNISISNPFSHEIKSLYPKAWEVAKISREIIFNKMGYLINDDEIAFITLHLQGSHHVSRNENLLVAMIIKESIQEIEKEYEILINEESLSYSRLLIHLKFLIARLEKDERLSLDLEDYTQKEIPHAYQLADKIVAKITEALGKEVPKIEIGYLAVHIERIIQEGQQI